MDNSSGHSVADIGYDYGVFSVGGTGQEGSACVDVKSGEWCMGKNLPLQMR